ncbi:MAG: SAVED domain-containing protein [Ilumatobacteraceae bacterium]
MHRIEQRRDHIARNRGVLTIATQTRPAPSALDAGASDLHIRINPPTQGRLPNRQGLRALQATLPLTSDAIAASGAATLRVTGGMHLSVAFALGAALPATKFGRVEVVDLTGEAWTSQDADSAPLHEVATVDIDGEFDEQPGGRSRIAVFVSLTEHADTSAFRHLIDERPRYFTSAAHLSLTSGGRIQHHEAATLSMAVANELRRLSATSGRAEIHLAYHGPATLALLIGRQLNTLRTVIYEWDDPETSGPQYHPIITVQPGITAGPITRVHPSRG